MLAHTFWCYHLIIMYKQKVRIILNKTPYILKYTYISKKTKRVRANTKTPRHNDTNQFCVDVKRPNIQNLSSAKAMVVRRGSQVMKCILPSSKMPSCCGKKLRQEETSDSLKEMNLQYAYINDNNQITT